MPVHSKSEIFYYLSSGLFYSCWFSDCNDLLFEDLQKLLLIYTVRSFNVCRLKFDNVYGKCFPCAIEYEQFEIICAQADEPV